MSTTAQPQKNTNLSALRTLITHVLAAVLFPMHQYAKSTEIVTAFQNDWVVKEVQANCTNQLLLQLISTGSSRHGHVYQEQQLGSAKKAEVLRRKGFWD